MHNGKSDKSSKPEDSSSELVEKILDEAANKGKAALGNAVEEAGELITEKFSTFKKKASEWGLDEIADEVKFYVKKNPWKSVGLAVGVGFLLNSLLRSSKQGE